MTKAQSTPVAGRPDGPEAAAYLGTTFGTRVVSVRDLVEAFGQSLGSVFFIGQPWLGLLLWGALLSRPALALFALCGLLSGVLVRGILRVQDAPGLGGGVKANALLTAVVTGWMIGPMGMPWAQQLVLAAAAAMAAALVIFFLGLKDDILVITWMKNGSPPTSIWPHRFCCPDSQRPNSNVACAKLALLNSFTQLMGSSST